MRVRETPSICVVVCCVSMPLYDRPVSIPIPSLDTDMNPSKKRSTTRFGIEYKFPYVKIHAGGGLGLLASWMHYFQRTNAYLATATSTLLKLGTWTWQVNPLQFIHLGIGLHPPVLHIERLALTLRSYSPNLLAGMFILALPSGKVLQRRGAG